MDIKELLDPKLPILEKFRDYAPGSYKHSQNVAGFCEAVALELGLDVDFMRAAGLYHDIGKIIAPETFSENQNGKNIHDDLEPSISFQMISRHVGDSAIVILNHVEDFDMKMKLLEVVTQHHGNTVVQYFFKKSKSDVEDAYRYRSTPPQSLEAAVLMICDTIEATARALASNGELEDKESRRAVVNTNVDRLMQDYQLDGITVGDLRKIKSVIYKELDNAYHKRELYGGEKENKDDSIKV